MNTACQDHYIACPSCHQALRVRYPGRSGMTETEWSDTFFGSEKKAFCQLSACPSCGQAFWVMDQDKLAKEARPTARDTAFAHSITLSAGWHGVTVPPDESPLPDHGEPFAQPASDQQMIQALASSSLPADRVLYLRTQLWHNANHPQRGFAIDAADTIPDEFHQANLQWLLSHQESKPRDVRDDVVEAELLREQGLFDAALKRIDLAVMSGSFRAVAIYQQLLLKRTAVCVVREGGGAVIY